jgi:2-aminobenzoate-CoA ligase
MHATMSHGDVAEIGAGGGFATGHVDHFVIDRLPASGDWPTLLLDPPYRQPARVNAAAALLDARVAAGGGARPCLIGPAGTWTYAELAGHVDRIARVLVESLGLVPGGRVLLRAPNGPMLAACWLAVVKAGGIAVATTPQLRPRELVQVIDKAEVGIALSDDRLLGGIEEARDRASTRCRVVPFEELAWRARDADPGFAAADTAGGDPCMIAFTSGTTGPPKAAVHFHRDVLAVTQGLPPLLGARSSDVFCGVPSLAFVYGLGGLLLFPLALGASSVLLEHPTPDAVLDAIARHRATILLGVPTAYRRLLDVLGDSQAANGLEAGGRGSAAAGLRSLRACVSAGESLPRPLFERWERATGLPLLDTIGSTEMLHTFIAAPPEAPRPGSTGKVLPGYQAAVLDEDLRPVRPGEPGRLGVRGPVGCRYLDDGRQSVYVQRGWNLTGDSFVQDEDGYFWYRTRTDDMIVSAGYNISGPEVEEVLAAHPAVCECAVVASPDPERGYVPKAFVVPTEDVAADERLAAELQAWVRARLAPFKYPRAVEFAPELPRTETGKLQRYKLRLLEERRATGEEG